MSKILKIRDLTLRGAQQSLFQARLRQKDINPLLPLYREAGFYIVEVWGGSLAGVMLHYLGESPWERLRKCAKELEGVSFLSAVTQGTRLFGGISYPNFVLEALYKEAFSNGLQMMRLFDSSNKLSHLTEPIELIKDLGGIPDVALLYFPPRDDEGNEAPKKKGLFSILFGDDDESEPKHLFDDDYYVELAKEAEEMGAKILTIKDIHGILTPHRMYSLMPKLKQAVKIPVDFHTHCHHGNGLASTLTAIIKGVDIVDTGIWWFAEGAAPPAIELIWIFCKKLEIEIGADMEAVALLREKLKNTRRSLSEFDPYKEAWPFDFDRLYNNIPENIDHLFDLAIQAASDDREEELIALCCRIEDYFGFPHAIVDDKTPESYQPAETESEDKDKDKPIENPEEPVNETSPIDEEKLIVELLPSIAETYSPKTEERQNDHSQNDKTD